jgi:hypothetical protein
MKIFKNQIVKICSYEKARNLHYSISETKVKVGIFKYEIKKTISSIYWMDYFKILEDYEMPNDSYVENDLVFLKPHCDIFLSNGKKEVKYFETKEELKSFVDEITKDCKILDL